MLGPVRRLVRGSVFLFHCIFVCGSNEAGDIGDHGTMCSSDIRPSGLMFCGSDVSVISCGITRKRVICLSFERGTRCTDKALKFVAPGKSTLRSGGSLVHKINQHA